MKKTLLVAIVAALASPGCSTQPSPTAPTGDSHRLGASRAVLPSESPTSGSPSSGSARDLAASFDLPRSGPSAVTFPPRNEPLQFRAALESKYRDGLRRSSVATYVDQEGTVVWTQEYLRYRVNLCSHANAVALVMRQIDGLGVQPTCGNSDTATFPPRNEPLDFMIQLETKYRDGLRRSAGMSFVDVEGNIVWTQEYLRYRVSSCAHDDAQQRVFDQLDGRGVQPDCTPCSAPPVMPGGQVLGWTTAGLPAGSVRFTWILDLGNNVTSWVFELGTTLGATNAGVVNVAATARSYTFAGLAPGDYYGRIRATNACGVSGPSRDAVPRVR